MSVFTKYKFTKHDHEFVLYVVGESVDVWIRTPTAKNLYPEGTKVIQFDRNDADQIVEMLESKDKDTKKYAEDVIYVAILHSVQYNNPIPTTIKVPFPGTLSVCFGFDTDTSKWCTQAPTNQFRHHLPI